MIKLSLQPRAFFGEVAPVHRQKCDIGRAAFFGEVAPVHRQKRGKNQDES
jgi:hypothetical protein